METTQDVTILFQPEGVRMPANFTGLRGFRSWAVSADFPEQGRIDWIGGVVEIDMSPEDLTTHGTPKAAIARDLGNIVEGRDLGAVFVDRARLTAPAADLSAEPDAVVVLFESVDAGRVRLVPRAHGPADRFVEIEGAADIVVECVSDSSETKDCQELPPRYYGAGVREYWLVDARGKEVLFTLFVHTPSGYAPALSDAAGFRSSGVLKARVRLVRLPVRSGLARFRLESCAP